MPRLDWTLEQGVKLAAEEQGSGKQGSSMSLTLELAAENLETLCQALEALFADGVGPELRLELSPAWTVFWKLREGESRLILAHPEKDAWVGSVSLNSVHAQPLLDGLRGLVARPGSSFEVGDLAELGGWSGISNFRLTLRGE